MTYIRVGCCNLQFCDLNNDEMCIPSTFDVLPVRILGAVVKTQHLIVISVITPNRLNLKIRQ